MNLKNTMIVGLLCVHGVDKLFAGIIFSACCKKQDAIEEKVAKMTAEQQILYKKYLKHRGAKEAAKLFVKRRQDYKHLSPRARRKNLQKVHFIDNAISRLQAQQVQSPTVVAQEQPQGGQLSSARLSNSESNQ